MTTGGIPRVVVVVDDAFPRFEDLRLLINATNVSYCCIFEGFIATVASDKLIQC